MSDDIPKVLVADDHPLFRGALRQVLAETFDAFEFVEAENIEEASAFLSRHEFDLVLLDLRMPGMSGFAGLVKLRNLSPATPIVVVSAEDAPAAINEAIVYGAAGFLPKSLPKEQMADALRAVLAGEIYTPAEAAQPSRHAFDDGSLGERLAALTPQQRCVLEMLLAGKSNKVIAYELDIAESTVKAHVSAVLRKLKVSSRTQAVINAAMILSQLRLRA